MKEGLPEPKVPETKVPETTSEAVVEAREKEPATYERALDAVRLLKQAGVKNPFDDMDIRVQEGLAPMEEWYHGHNLHMGGVGSMEKAEDIVKAARIFLDAGFEGSEIVRAAKEKLQDEYAIAEREEDKGPARVIATALKVFEKEEMRELVENKMGEAEALVEQGKIRDAVGVLTLALFDPRFKRLPKPLLAAMTERRDSLKTQL